MKTQSLLSKLLVLIFATLVVNQMACNNASFEAADETNGQSAPAPDNVNDPFNTSDSGDAVRCDNSSDLFCDPGDNGLTDNVPTLTWNPPTSDINRNGQCYSNTYRDTRRNTINGVTVWLVVDSSRSFDKERVAVANALTSNNGFIRNFLNDGVSVTVSVVASHAPSGSYGGQRSFAPSRNAGTFYGTSVTINRASELSFKRAQLMSQLSASMQESPISLAKRARGSVEVNGITRSWPLAGPHSGSDELGLLNFIDAIDNRPYIPRDNAWVVLFMSDENDACTPLVQNGSYVYSHPTDEKEMKDWFCSGITPSLAYSKAVQYAGDRPFAIGSLVYTGTASIPSDAHPQASYGKGYTQVAAKAGGQGVIIDLASRSFLGLQTTANRIVRELENITNESVGTHTQYPIYDSNRNRLSLNRVATVNGKFDMQVYVNGSRSNYTTDSANSLVRPSRLGSEVRIEFCLK